MRTPNAGAACLLLAGSLASVGHRQAFAKSGPMSGMFVYMADAASFTECSTGKRFPVAMEKAYLKLERAYNRQPGAPGSPLYVTIRGHVTDRPKVDGGGKKPTLIIDEVVSTPSGGRCGNAR